MKTLQNMIDDLAQHTRDTNKSPSYVEGLNRLIAVMDKANTALGGLKSSVDQQIALNKAAEKVGKASDVQKTIKDMLKAQIAADTIERERYARFQDMAEKLVGPVTDEQIDAFREQKAAFKEHQKVLNATLDIEKKKAETQKKAFDDIAKKNTARLDRERKESEFAAKDKYGTIGSAIGGLESRAQDPLSKFLVQGLGRFVKEQREAPAIKAIEDKYTTDAKKFQEKVDAQKALVDARLQEKQETIKESFDIKAAREGIVDPGAITSLFKTRDEQVAKLANMASRNEAKLLNSSKNPPKPPSNNTSTEISKDTTVKPSPTTTATVVTPTEKKTESPAPQARFSRPTEQQSGLMTPGTTRERVTGSPTTPSTTRPTGATKILGSKTGAFNPSAILNGIKSLERNFTKFLGPWGLIANSLMSFDRMVPIISDGAGALMDLSKLAMPLIVSSTTEGFASIAMAVNGILEWLDNSMWGAGFVKDNQAAISSREEAYMKERESPAIKARLDALKAASAGAGKGVNTTSARSVIRMTKQEALQDLTTPLEESAIHSRVSSTDNGVATTDMNLLISGLSTLPDMLKGIQQSVLEASHNPGTTAVNMYGPSKPSWA